MSEGEPIMKSRRILAALLGLMPWLPRVVFAESLPSPVTKTIFDVSRKGSVAVIDFIIKKPRSYAFALQFSYVGSDDLYRVLSLVGDGSQKSPGIGIPIHLKITRLGKDGGGVYDGAVITKKYYAHGFGGLWDPPKSGDFSREIITINLDQGIYRVEAETVDDVPAFAGVPSYLLIDYYANLQFVPGAK